MSASIPESTCASNSEGRITVLIVDDSSANQLALKRLVRTIGKKIFGKPPAVVCVADGAQAVESVQTGKYVLILMDIHMPVMDGVQATREIRKR
jgi:CheY-like chemotaxis protein